MRPLETAARKGGVEILLEHRMTRIYRQAPNAGPVLGIAVDRKSGGPIDIRARKAVIIGTGGSTGNVNFRRMFDPRLTEEYCGLAGMPWSDQDASGELAAMAIGAALWGFYNQIGEFGSNLTKPNFIGCQYNYRHLSWLPGSPVFDKRAGQRSLRQGLAGCDLRQHARPALLRRDRRPIHRQQLQLDRELHAGRLAQRASAANTTPNNWLNAALAGIDDGHNGGGPIWAIFDSDAVAREDWQPQPPHVDIAAGFFFSANRLADLAEKIVMKYQRVPMPPANLEATVARYNSFVERGADADFDKPTPRHRDRETTLLCGLGNAGRPRHARRPAHQCRLPGHRHERRGHPRPLLRR